MCSLPVERKHFYVVYLVLIGMNINPHPSFSYFAYYPISHFTPFPFLSFLLYLFTYFSAYLLSYYFIFLFLLPFFGAACSFMASNLAREFSHAGSCLFSFRGNSETGLGDSVTVTLPRRGGLRAGLSNLNRAAR